MFRSFISVFALVLVAYTISPLALAQSLKPYQQEALDKLLSTMDAESRPAMRAQMEPILVTMNPVQVQMMMESMQASEQEDAEVLQPENEVAETVATPEDLEYNRAQYEPAIRKAWQAQKLFDDFVSNLLDQECGKPGEFAVFGSGWRWELYPLNPSWPRASDSADLDVQIIGSSYVQADARYQYDFSGVKTRFDQQATAAAVKTACESYNQVGVAFLEEARSKMSGGYLPGGFEMENAANMKISPIRDRLETELKHLSPAGDGALFVALLNGEPLTH